MPRIRPISDLRNHFAEITSEVQADNEPVFLTKNGVGTLVVMSMEAYENALYDSKVYEALMEAEVESRETSKRYSHEEVMSRATDRLAALLKERGEKDD